MALVLSDRVQESSTTTGTGAFTLAGAANGFQSFNSGVGNGNTTYYTIADSTNNAWEVGVGTYTSSGASLSRDTVLSSSNSGSLVNFGAGSKQVFVTYAASKSVYTDGSYADPSWITSINYSKLTGTVPTWNQNTTGSAATFTSTTQNSQFNSVGVGTAGSGTAGEIRATNNVTAYYSSDRSLKENIKDVSNSLDIVCAIGSKTFDWTDDYIKAKGGEDGYFVTKSDFGVIAQDVKQVFPQAVRTRDDGTLAVDYEKLATLSFGAIKELVKRIEDLENK